MKKTTVLLCICVIGLLNIAAIFSSYNFVSPSDFNNWLETDKPVIIVDIQEKEPFAKHHFKNSIETNAYPVKTEEERQRIAPAVEQFKAGNHDVVVICPRGGGGAKRCYDYLKSQGIPDNKLFILEGGVDKWPYPDMLVGPQATLQYYRPVSVDATTNT